MPPQHLEWHDEPERLNVESIGNFSSNRQTYNGDRDIYDKVLVAQQPPCRAILGSYIDEMVDSGSSSKSERHTATANKHANIAKRHGLTTQNHLSLQ